jgi:hypothetical protein
VFVKTSTSFPGKKRNEVDVDGAAGDSGRLLRIAFFFSSLPQYRCADGDRAAKRKRLAKGDDAKEDSRSSIACNGRQQAKTAIYFTAIRASASLGLSPSFSTAPPSGVPRCNCYVVVGGVCPVFNDREQRRATLQMSPGTEVVLLKGRRAGSKFLVSCEHSQSAQSAGSKKCQLRAQKEEEEKSSTRLPRCLLLILVTIDVGKSRQLRCRWSNLRSTAGI